MKAIAFLLVAAIAGLAGETPDPSQIMARVVERDRERQEALGTYSYTSTYVLRNKDRHAEMVLRWVRHSDGAKEFVILSEQGDGGVRKHVFHKLLDAEVEASEPEQQARARINPDNYSFQLVGAEDLDGHKTFVIALEPKTPNKFSTRGRIWVDACDFAIVRVEGSPAHKVSFWTKDVSFVQTFQKSGGWWLPATNNSVTDARLFGLADLKIEYSHYDFANPQAPSAEVAAR
jgi:outer membrane lipoprotein-sorting protein